MKTINLNTFSTADVTEQISKAYLGKLDAICLSNTVRIPSAHGAGYIQAIDFENGLSLLIFNMELKDDLTLNFVKGNAYPLNFLHCSKGVLIHKFCGEDIQYQLEPMHNSLTACPCDAEQSFTIPSGQLLKAAILSVDRTQYTELSNCQEGDLPETFKTAILDEKSEGIFFYQGNSDYQLSQAIKELFDADTDNLEEIIFAESTMFNALGHFIRNYRENQSPDRYRTALNKYDVDCLSKAKDIIISQLQNPPTIPELAKMVGVNQQKLKKGFKNVFGKTINQFLIHQRMETAKILLLQQNSSIREVATQVGYSNQSHFSSKFRDHFGMLPKDFLKSISTNQFQVSSN